MKKLKINITEIYNNFRLLILPHKIYCIAWLLILVLVLLTLMSSYQNVLFIIIFILSGVLFILGFFIEIWPLLLKCWGNKIFKWFTSVIIFPIMTFSSIIISKEEIACITGFQPSSYPLSTTIISYFNIILVFICFAYLILLLVIVVLLIDSIPYAVRNYPGISHIFDIILKYIKNSKIRDYLDKKKSDRRVMHIFSKILGAFSLMLVGTILISILNVNNRYVKNFYSYIIYFSEYQTALKNPKVKKGVKICYNGDGLISYAKVNTNWTIDFNVYNKK